LREACGFIARHHRHHVPPQGGLVAMGLWEGEKLVGIAMLGRPVSRVAQANGDVELTRLCVLPGVEHAASALQARMRRVAQSLGFNRMITYTLANEAGASMRAAGMQRDLKLTEGGEWTTPSLKRLPANFPTARKIRWWTELKSQHEIEL
jgi:hypothetical protein